MRAVIVCNGEILDYDYYKRYLKDSPVVVGVDGGARHLKKLGIKPDVLMGDFDSIDKADLDYYRDMGIEIIKYPTQKDMTDTELSIEYLAEKGCKHVTIIGGIGSRLDHSLANIFILKKVLAFGMQGIIAKEYNEITIMNGHITLEQEKHQKVTLLALSEKVEGVTTKGLLYPLVDATLELGSSWGVSNEFTEEIAEVSIKNGMMLVIKSTDGG